VTAITGAAQTFKESARTFKPLPDGGWYFGLFERTG
jgi:hypothetical protein